MKGSFGGDDSQGIWTKEAKRVEQITKVEDRINQYKEIGEWGLVLNALEDYLRFQVEAIEEKGEDKKKRQGIETATYQMQMGEILELEEEWERATMNPRDPVQKMNNAMDRRDLISRIKKMIDKIYHNNIVYNLTYRKKPDPMEAWKH